jgi:hypothetical protein
LLPDRGFDRPGHFCKLPKIAATFADAHRSRQDADTAPASQGLKQCQGKCQLSQAAPSGRASLVAGVTKSVLRIYFSLGLARRDRKEIERNMETEWYNRAEAIQKRITQLRDSL